MHSTPDTVLTSPAVYAKTTASPIERMELAERKQLNAEMKPAPFSLGDMFCRK